MARAAITSRSSSCRGRSGAGSGRLNRDEASGHSGRDRRWQRLPGCVLVVVVPDHLPARRVRVSGKRDHGGGVVLDQIREADEATVGRVPRLEPLQLAPPPGRVGHLGPHLPFLGGQFGGGLVVLVGEVGCDGAAVRPEGEGRPQGGVLGALGGRAGGGGTVEDANDLDVGGGEGVEQVAPSTGVPGRRQLVHDAAGRVQQAGAVRGEIRGIRRESCFVAASECDCCGVVVNGAAVAVTGGVERRLGLAVNDHHSQSEAACSGNQFAVSVVGVSGIASSWRRAQRCDRRPGGACAVMAGGRAGPAGATCRRVS